ncbi:MAG TPA: hypothetical protein PLJ31_14820 [Armatimonadota bacterium]|nr:hypothetical protein [Armatimonadota bacterium]
MAGNEKETPEARLQISGIYPHLAVFSHEGEVGIGAVVPWAGKLWMITYPPHHRTGGPDKLYEIDPDLNVTIRPESVGGTHACRMIHRESNQLIIGPYFIDARGGVRAADPHVLVGRMTAVMRHLKDPANKVYFFDMEGPIYEVDVHTLTVKLLFEKPVPGWHGKGGYTAQGRVVIANNGERQAIDGPFHFLAEPETTTPEDAGILAEWDGERWRVIERKQYCEVTGPGGICGAPDDQSPLWASGWDKRSVILKLLDGGQWSTFRIPKASHCYDPIHGWYTEWPRIREVGGGKWMMTMHGMFWDFPPGFRAGATGGLAPIASHLRYIPDFCDWNGRLILAGDDTSIMQNPMAGQSQSNLWFGTRDDLRAFGPRSGWGGPWLQDAVRAGEASDPFLIHGFDRRVVHLSHDADAPVRFTLECDPDGQDRWQVHHTVTVPARGSAYYIFPTGFEAAWARVKTDRDCTATAYFHCTSPRDTSRDDPALFAGLASVDSPEPFSAALIRPAKHNRNLQVLAWEVDASGQATSAGYYEVDGDLRIGRADEDRSEEVEQIASVKQEFTVDAASVIMTLGGARYRLPKAAAAYDQPFATGWPRCVRECVSERYLVNAHGTFYEMPRDEGLPLIKPVCTHNRRILDFCTWRGLMVLSGVRAGAKPDGHIFRSPDGRVALWFGHIDDLWQLGKPAGKGGPWLQTSASPEEPSDPYLMTGYDRKQLDLSHDAATEVTFQIEVDTDHHGWHAYQEIRVPAGQVVTHHFPEGYNAHWIRFRVDRPCRATALLTYS